MRRIFGQRQKNASHDEEENNFKERRLFNAMHPGPGTRYKVQILKLLHKRQKVFHYTKMLNIKILYQEIFQ